MNSLRHFTADDSLIDLIREDYNLLPVLSRFSMPLGFGNKTIGQHCADSSIDPDVFLLTVNFILSGAIDSDKMDRVTPGRVVDFLHNSHDYFLSYKFPHIRSVLIDALDDSQTDINPALIAFFDRFVSHAHEHFKYEESVVFPYVKALEKGDNTDYDINTFSSQHEEITEPLRELKNIIMRYYATSKPDKMYDALVDIYTVEEDLRSHNMIENEILVPLIRGLEPRRRGRRK